MLDSQEPAVMAGSGSGSTMPDRQEGAVMATSGGGSPAPAGPEVDSGRGATPDYDREE